MRPSWRLVSAGGFWSVAPGLPQRATGAPEPDPPVASVDWQVGRTTEMDVMLFCALGPGA